MMLPFLYALWVKIVYIGLYLIIDFRKVLRPLTEPFLYDWLLTHKSHDFFIFLNSYIRDSKLKICIVSFMGTISRYFEILWIYWSAEKWKQMTSSCKYIDHTSYSLDCNRCNEVDWSQFEIKYNLDISILPYRNSLNILYIFKFRWE